MNDDREAVLAQIRASLQTAHLPAARATLPPRPPTLPGERPAMIEAFTRELTAVGGNVYCVTNSDQALARVMEILNAADGKEILAWSDTELPLPHLGEAIRNAGFVSLDPNLPTDDEGRRVRLAELAHAGVGVTGAQAGLADTGSLVLLSGTKRPRLASLLPPVHVALLKTSDLLPTMSSYFAAHPEIVRAGSNLVFVTGPSRSADIELTLTRGVHGPRHVHVILLDSN